MSQDTLQVAMLKQLLHEARADIERLTKERDEIDEAFRRWRANHASTPTEEKP